MPLPVLACLALAACVTESRRDASPDTAGDSACTDNCAQSFATTPSCYTAVWNESSCTCSLVAEPVDAPCDDGNACTLEDRCTADQKCLGELVDLNAYCEDGDDCTSDNCDQNLGCTHDPVEAGSLCDDGNQCTFDSRCTTSGACRWDNQYICGLCTPGAPDACADENAQQDRCDGRLTCVGGYCEVDAQTVPPCDDPRLDPCLVPGCDGGDCTTAPLPDGTECSDLSQCTKGDRCLAGVCTGTPVDVPACACDDPRDCSALDDGDLCNGGMTCRAASGQPGSAGPSAGGGVCMHDFGSIVVCDTASDTSCSVTRCVPETGACEPEAAPDASPCDDADPCTLEDACASGACVGMQRDCTALDGRCLVGVCDRLFGCVAEVAPTGAACTQPGPCAPQGECDAAGDCVTQTRGCDDGDPCSVDACNEETNECEHYGPPKPSCPTEGVCAGGVPLRCELGEYFCDFAKVLEWSAVEACDGEDDDCDGETDEACIAGEACVEGALFLAWSGTMQACQGATTVGDASCGSGWYVCDYSAMVDALGGDVPPAGFFLAASIAFTPGTGFRVNDRPGSGCFEFDGICTNAREVQAMTWDGVFGSTVAYAAEAWGCSDGAPTSSCESATFQGVMCCAPECDAGADCNDGSPCTADSCAGGRCVNVAGAIPECAAVGVCAGVTPSCQPDGKFLCNYAEVSDWQAIEGACDGLDNDCDGLTDGDDGNFAPASEPCELQAGVCQGAQKGKELCQDSAFIACRASDYDEHSPYYEQGDESSCDGRDNDCDARVDGGFAWHKRVVGQSCDGTGACGVGAIECAPSGSAATCSSNPDGSASQAAPEACDGLDNDCDGLTDEPEDLDASDSGCGSQGVCAGLPVARCTAASWVCDTDGIVGYGAEACDGLDNDCDGDIDEGFVTGGKAIGDSCGPVSCPRGVVICASPSAAACSSDVPGSEEPCDEVDNDCDGATDEGLTWADGTLGTRQLGQTCSGRGACGLGVIECASDRSVTCSTLANGSNSKARIETCDETDDDCDGLTDESFTLQGVALDEDCEGRGVCGPGAVVCSLDGARALCSSEPGAPASEGGSESCNALDDDCDGVTDEGVAADESDCPSDGVCRPAALFATCHGADGWECDYTASPYYQAGNELGRCDGRDNDCDGATDEDFPGLGAACDSADADKCARGFTACDLADPTRTTCAGDHMLVETCNGADDDCDSQTDEQDARGCSVYHRDGDRDLFGTDEVRCLCLPSGDFSAFVSGDCDDGHAGTSPAAPELCNGDDDDCDDKTDGADAADLVVDDPVPCELTLGVCQGVAKPASRCVAGAWQACQTGDYGADYQTPKETRCDGLDNDCDGDLDAQDEDISSAPPLCELQQGVCAGLAKPLTLCAQAGWAACDSAQYSAWSAIYEAGSELSCDDEDNDCDGLIDDDLTWGGKKVGQSCDGTGVCGLGTVECKSDGSAATCSTNPDGSGNQEQPESCDGLDNDCDGVTDDGLGLAQSPCRRVGVCTEALVIASCSQGTWSCDYSRIDDYEAGTELSCDELDNDCDGPTDEDASAVVEGQTLRKGDPCGSGACTGAMVCNVQTPAAGDLICSSEVNGGAEVCDHLDNDCDGATDEGITWTPVGGAPVALGGSCEGHGECGEGVVECNLNLAATCSTQPDGSEDESSPETCNGLDDDCDRDNDDGFTWEGIAVGQSCNGTGACGIGVVECLESGAAATCSTNPDGSHPGASDEGCNGIDDDCDGTTDEDLGIGDSNCRLTGVCNTGNVIALCQGASGWSCDYSNVPGYHAGDEIGYCDGLDNDCDGVTDEDYPELGQACDGEDADLCAYGTWICVMIAPPTDPDETPSDGGGTPTCIGDTPSPEECGNGDEDCDGSVDEPGAQGCTVYFKDVDGDTYGLQNDFKCLCSRGQVPFYTALPNSNCGAAGSICFDCNDGNPNIRPNATEVCNSQDDDCDAQTDEDGAVGCETYYKDGDQDGYGLTNDTRCLCSQSQGTGTKHTTKVPGDCDDTLATVHPNAPELCDGKDNDCDGNSDDGDPPVQGCTTFFYDFDGDTYGVQGNTQCRCLPGDKYTATRPGDCCDSDTRAHQDVTEWFPGPNNCGSFDYNCVSGAELQYPTYGACGTDTGEICGFASDCDYLAGWARSKDGVISAVPTCGGSASFVASCACITLSCNTLVENRQQKCH